MIDRVRVDFVLVEVLVKKNFESLQVTLIPWVPLDNNPPRNGIVLSLCAASSSSPVPAVVPRSRPWGPGEPGRDQRNEPTPAWQQR
jgi:hypothetical protein